MHWQTFISTLLGGLITYSAILLTNALDLHKRKRTHEKLIHALLQGLRDEIAGLLEMAETSPVRPIEAVPPGKPYEGLFTASQDYFIVYHANAELVMQIADPDLRRSIMQTYTRAKAVLDTVKMNRLYLERYRYLQSTFQGKVGSCTLKDTAICKVPSSKRRMHRFRRSVRAISGRSCRLPHSLNRPMPSSGEQPPAYWRSYQRRSERSPERRY